jgi:hypothetical protein
MEAWELPFNIDRVKMPSRTFGDTDYYKREFVSAGQRVRSITFFFLRHEIMNA